MKHNNNAGWIALVIFLTITTLIFAINPSGPLRTLLFISEIIAGLILVTGVVIIPNEPPHLAIVPRWGKREWREDGNGNPTVSFIEEGWNWLFLRGIMHKVILIDRSKRDIDFDEQILTTKEGATTRVPGSMAYSVDKDNIISLLNLGGNDPFVKLEDMITDIVEEKLRVWARGIETWEVLLNSHTDAIKMLIQEICGPEETITDEDIAKIRSGNGDWKIKKFGIILNRFNLKEMTSYGEIYEQSLKQKSESEQRKAETFEVETDAMRASKLQEQLRALGKEMSIEECLEKVMSWKITREANQSMSLVALASTIAKGFKQETT